MSAHLNRGNTYLIKGEYDAAVADFNKAIQLDPGHATSYSNRSLAYIKKGLFDYALTDSEVSSKSV